VSSRAARVALIFAALTISGSACLTGLGMVDHFIKLTQVIKPFWCGRDGSNRLFRNRERIRARKRAADASTSTVSAEVRKQ